MSEHDTQLDIVLDTQLETQHDAQLDKYVTFKSGSEYFGLKIEDAPSQKLRTKLPEFLFPL